MTVEHLTATDILIALAAARIGCAITCAMPADPMSPRIVTVTGRHGTEHTVQISVKLDLLPITELLLAAYNAPEPTQP